MLGDLTDRDRAILTLEAAWPRHRGMKEETIRSQLGMSPARYYQLLGRLIETEQALQFDPLLVRRLPGAATPREVLATYDLSLAIRQREVPLVIARNPVDAIDAPLVSSTTGRVYQVVLAPLIIKGEALLFIASMPEGQAEQAWPLLATMLGSVDFVAD